MTYATRTKAPFKEAPCFILKVEQEQSPSSCRLLLSLTTVPSFKWFQPVAGNRTEWPCSQQAFLSFFEKLLIVETQCQCANVSPNADENWYLLHLLMTDLLNLKMSTMTLLLLPVCGLPIGPALYPKEQMQMHDHYTAPCTFLTPSTFHFKYYMIACKTFIVEYRVASK